MNRIVLVYFIYGNAINVVSMKIHSKIAIIISMFVSLSVQSASYKPL